jgi:hypothetical protein
MQRRALLTIAFVAMVVVPVALAVQPPGKGPNPTGPGCKPKVTVLLKGTLTSNPAFVGAGIFTMNTTGANKHGKNFVGGLDETIAVSADTKIRRQNSPKLVASLELGDRAVVHIRACKADLPLDAAELLLTPAARINAKAPPAP